MSYRLGINLGFAINRYPEPEVWAKIVAEDLGLHSVQFVADLLNPFWPSAYIETQIGRIKKCIRKYDIKVESVFTSAFTRVNHLMNPDIKARAFWMDWFRSLIVRGSELGAKSLGSHFGIMTFATYDNNEKRRYITERAVKAWQELTFFAQDKGYDCLIFEPMSVPREMACTIEETHGLLEQVNAKCGVPMKLCLDVGHAPHPDERDPYLWLEKLSKQSEVIHLQQTVKNKSNHWPFIEEYNKKGIIKPEKVLKIVKKAGAEDVLFAFEISHREHWDTDFRVIQDLKESVNYWRPYFE
jgi:hypothetical protein